MKRNQVISLFLLLALALPIGITYSYLHFKKHAVKREIKWRIIDGLDRDELELITLSHNHIENEIEWEHDHEFKYKGEMYDVVERRSTGDSISFWCWWDHDETLLTKKLKNLLNEALGSDSQKKEKEHRLLTYYKSLYFNGMVQISWHLTDNDFKHQRAFKDNYHSPALALPDPPPIST